MRIAILAASAGLIATSALGAQTQQSRSGDPSQVPGRWMPARVDLAYLETASSPVSAASVHSIELRIQAVLELFHATPTLAKPMGFGAWPSYLVTYSERGWETSRYRWPVPVHAQIRIVDHWTDSRNGDVHVAGENREFLKDRVPSVPTANPNPHGYSAGAVVKRASEPVPMRRALRSASTNRCRSSTVEYAPPAEPPR